ncbi:MAG: PIN domain-containing protein [Fibromonadaceae bacterium]|jgi:predicted nucleic acid-binding protein|nr:PIN domain-containing protein [Fibromonadaceae bacterium]
MKDKVFLDSNILIYLYSEDELQKRNVANDIFDKYECIISTQALNEFCSVCIKKLNKTISEIIESLNEIKENSRMKFIDDKTIEQALLLHEKYLYSYFDSLMLSSALENDCKIIYSEDMQHGQVIENVLKIVNPFV